MNLWLVLSPEEIKEEFGARAKSPRQIRRLYEKHHLSNMREMRKELAAHYKQQKPMHVDLKCFVSEQLRERATACVSHIWDKIEKLEKEEEWDSI